MKSMNRFHFNVGMASSLVMAACGALAQDTETYTPLGLQNRPPLKTAWQADTNAIAQLGVGYTSEDNFMFGEYNGLNKEGANVIGNLQWQDFNRGDNYLQGYVSNIGLDTREGELTWAGPENSP